MEQQPLWALLLFQFRKTYYASASVDSLEHQNHAYKRKICRNSFENTERKQLFHFVWWNFCLLCPICRMVIRMFVSGTSINSQIVHTETTKKKFLWKKLLQEFLLCHKHENLHSVFVFLLLWILFHCWVDWIYIIIYSVSGKVTVPKCAIHLSNGLGYPHSKSKRSGNGKVPTETRLLVWTQKISQINRNSSNNNILIIQWTHWKYRFWRVDKFRFRAQNMPARKPNLTWYDLIFSNGTKIYCYWPIQRKHFCKQHIFFDPW